MESTISDHLFKLAYGEEDLRELRTLVHDHNTAVHSLFFWPNGCRKRHDGRVEIAASAKFKKTFEVITKTNFFSKKDDAKGMKILRAFVKRHPELLSAMQSVPCGFDQMRTTLGYAAENAEAGAVAVLLDSGADPAPEDKERFTPMYHALQEVSSCYDYGDADPDDPHEMGKSMRGRQCVFALLCFGEKAFNVDPKADRHFPQEKYSASEYEATHAFIEEYHGVLTHTLSHDAVVDTRMGRGGYGLYQEPLERVLEYCGLSMKKDQVVNGSIDGGIEKQLSKGQMMKMGPLGFMCKLMSKEQKKAHRARVLRVLIPKCAHNAMYWFKLANVPVAERDEAAEAKSWDLSTANLSSCAQQ